MNRSLSRVHSIAFNKPYGVLPCFTDPKGRPTLADYVAIPGIYAAGRLDLDSEGLILLTSDGTLAHHITDPQHKLSKVYLAQVERLPNEEALEQLRKGQNNACADGTTSKKITANTLNEFGRSSLIKCEAIT